MNTQTKLNAICFYAGKDQAIQEVANVYFDSFHTCYISSIEFQQVDQLTSEKLDELLAEKDLVVILGSLNLIRLKLWDSFAARRISSKHHLKILAAAVIVIDKFDERHDPFDKLPQLPANNKPLNSYYWANPEHGMKVAFRELMKMCQTQILHLSEIEKAWGEARKEDTRKEYEAFFLKHPYSKFASQAKEKYQTITDDKLWKKAKKKNEIHSYVNYLRKTAVENKKRQCKAAERIYHLEANIDIRWKELMEQRVLKLFYQFLSLMAAIFQKKRGLQISLLGGGNLYDKVTKTRYDNYVKTANLVINHEPFTFEKEPFKPRELQTNYLDFLAVKKHKSHEVFDYRIYSDFINNVIRRLIETQKAQIMKKENLLLMGTSFFFLFLILLLFPSTLLPYYIGGGLFTAYYLINCYYNIDTDLYSLSRGIKSLQTMQVLLRLALVRHDKFFIEKAMRFFDKIDKKSEKIKKKHALTYFYNTLTTYKGMDMEIPIEITGKEVKNGIQRFWNNRTIMWINVVLLVIMIAIMVAVYYIESKEIV